MTAVGIGCRNGDDLTTQRPHQFAVFAFRVHDNDVVVGRKSQGRHFLLCRHRLARTGHAGDEAIAVQQVSAIADDKVMGNSIDAVVDAASVLNFL